uniref:POU domain protein n=1 Tax=Petromyzon marinus TaxID=7757 RepID=A0AAJ7SIP4_PETMA|nr:POU domain, class 3, transcription factor 3-like [Petromyzon marinus]
MIHTTWSAVDGQAVIPRAVTSPRRDDRDDVADDVDEGAGPPAATSRAGGGAEVELEQLEQFARNFKQRRIKLGHTQGDVGVAMGRIHGNAFSQTTISRFEALNLSYRNMARIRPLLEAWLLNMESPSGCVHRCSLPWRSLRRKRTSLDAAVRAQLEIHFLRNPKPSSHEVLSLSRSLCVERDVVRVWFCNRRQKQKRITVRD